MRRLYRSTSDRILGGVCGGLGAYFRIPPSLIRLALLFVSIITGILPLFLIYLLMILIIPNEPKGHVAPDYPTIYRSKKNRVFGGICGGIGEAMNWDPTILRVLCVIICLLTGFVPFLVTYLLGCLIIPSRKGY